MIGAEIHMMTIDDMLSEVSKLVKASEPETEKTVVRHEAVIQKPERNAGNSGHCEKTCRA